jgi:hypothetical protein
LKLYGFSWLVHFFKIKATEIMLPQSHAVEQLWTAGDMKHFYNVSGKTEPLKIHQNFTKNQRTFLHNTYNIFCGK